MIYQNNKCNTFVGTLLIIPTLSFAELTPLTSDDLANYVAQSGVTIEGNVNLTIENISYQQRPDSSHLMINDLVAKYEYGPTTLDITNNGAIRFGLPEFVHFEELSFGLYNSASAQLDVNNPVNTQTYRIYASTLGDSYDSFKLDISGTSFDNGSNRYQDDYVNTNTLENNANTSFTIDKATDLTIDLESDDDGWFAEDYAKITVVNEEGDIIGEAGRDGQNDASLSLHFDSPVNHTFLLQATLTGAMKMGGAIEMFSTANIPIKR